MKIKDFLIKVLTPKDTEEIKPSFFLQTKYKKITDEDWKVIAREPIKYRQVLPLVWEGKFLWKEQLRTVINFKVLIWLIILLFIVWSYNHDVKEYKIFYEEVMNNVEIRECLRNENICTFEDVIEGIPCIPGKNLNISLSS